MRILILLTVIGLSGCAATSQWGEAKTGGAVYSYQHNNGQETCAINITSAREVLGVDVEVLPDCTIKTTTQSSGNVTDVIGVIGGLVNRLPAPQK